jgi:hypothetical protein
VSLVDTVNARCREGGLEDSTLPFATVRTPEQASATMVNGGNARSTLRELPRISIEVRGTLSGGEGQALTPGDTIRDIEVLETLGEGGMGRVFLARQHSLDREVAIARRCACSFPSSCTVRPTSELSRSAFGFPVRLKLV